MKKILFILIAVTMLFTACNSKPSAKEDFLKVNLGMSTIELLDIFGEPDREILPLPDGNNITFYWYNNRVAFGMQDVHLSFAVDENGVCQMSADFHSNYSDNKSYLTEYDAVKKNLISEWGEPMDTIDDENSFKYICDWGNKFLVLYRKEDNSVDFFVSAYTQDYLDKNSWITEAWTTE